MHAGSLVRTLTHRHTRIHTDEGYTINEKMKIRREMIENRLKMFSSHVFNDTKHRKRKQLNHLNNILTKLNEAQANDCGRFTFSLNFFFVSQK